MISLPTSTAPTRADADALDARALMSSTISEQRKLILVLGVSICALALGFVVLLPLKTVEPYVIEVNRTTGEVTAPSQQLASKFVPDDDSVYFFARRWMTAFLSIQAQLNERNEGLTLATLRGDAAITKHRSFRVEDQTFTRIAREPSLVRDVTINSISTVSGSTRSLVSNVTLTTSSRAGTEQARYLVTIFYELLPPRNPKDRELHPIGFYVVDFTIAKQQ